MYEIALRDHDLLPAIRNHDLLPAVRDQGLLPSLRNEIPSVEIDHELPVIDMMPPTEIKIPWYKRKPKIVVVQLDDVFEYEKNKMVTYQMIPHANVSANNRKVWRSVQRMYELYEKMGSRLERKGFKIHFREKDFLWFDVLFRQEDGERKIEFYVTTSEYQAEKLKRKLEHQMNVTLREADEEHFCIPEENTVIQDMKYARHDIFSLDTTTNDKQSTMASIIGNIEELQFDGDKARLSICHEYENRRKWIKNASWSREKLANGKVPQRANLSLKKVKPVVKRGLAGIVNELSALLDDTFEAISNSFLKSDKKITKEERLKEKGYSLKDEINSSKLSSASLGKVNLPVFKTHIRVAAHSEDRLTRETMSESLAMSLNEISEDNELYGTKINSKSRKKEVLEEMNTFKLSNKTKYDSDVNLVSTDELNKISLQLPQRELQMKYPDELNVKTRVETTIPNVLRKATNLQMGFSESKDKKIPVGLDTQSKDDFYCGYTFIGKQGSGKDTAIHNFVYEGALKHNISFIIPDWICQEGWKGMADGIRDLLPPDKIIDLDLSNEEWAVPMDLSEVVTKLGRLGGSRFANEMVDFFDLSKFPRTEKYLMEASKAAGGSLKNIKRIIEDESYREGCIERLISEGNERLAKDLIMWGSNEDLGSKCDPILSRLNKFFGDETLYDIFSQDPHPEVDFEKWMREGKTIIIRMPKRKLGSASNTLAHWVTLKVLMTRFLMSDEDKERHGCFIVFNEPEQVESVGLSDLMGRIATEGRKERLGSIFAFHHWDKLSLPLQKNLQAGGVNRFLFASDKKSTFEESKERLEPQFTVEEAMQTPKRYSIALINTKEALPAVLISMQPPVPPELRYDNSALTKQHAERFGRHWRDLQKM